MQRSPSRICFVALVALLLGAGANAVLAAEKCPSHQPEARLAAIAAAGSCAQAIALNNLCSIGARGDLEPTSAVMQRCEKDFLPKLTKRQRAQYENDRQVCIAKYRKRRGSLAASLNLHCLADVAQTYSKRFAKP